MKVLLIACIHRVGTTNSHVRSQPSLLGSRLRARQSPRESRFQRVRAPSRILCFVHSRTFVAVLSLHRITCHAVCALHPSIVGPPRARTPLAPHPSFQAHLAADVIFGFIDVSSWRYPPMEVAFRMPLIMKSGRRQLCRKPKMLAITLIAALGQPSKLISGCTWSPNPSHPIVIFWRLRSPRFDLDPHAFSREHLHVSPRVSTFEPLRDLRRRF